MSSIQTTPQTCTTASRRKFAGSLNATCWWSAPSISSCVRSEEIEFQSQLKIPCLCLTVCVLEHSSHNKISSFLRLCFSDLILLTCSDTLFFVNYTKAHLTYCARGRRDIWALITWWKQSDSVFNHSIVAQTAQRKMIISWNCWFSRCFCLVCKRLQLCMCSAGSLSFPFSTLPKLDRARQLNEGEEPQSVEPVGVPRASSLLLVSVCLTDASREEEQP